MVNKTFLDQIEADAAAMDFIGRVAADCKVPEVVEYSLMHGTCPVDGRLYVLMNGFRIVAQATIIRDVGNNSILNCFDLRDAIIPNEDKYRENPDGWILVSKAIGYVKAQTCDDGSKYAFLPVFGEEYDN